MIKLDHKYTWLWQKNGLLNELARDQNENLQPLSWYIKQLPKAAKRLAKDYPIDSAYASYFGWQGEVLCEFWLKLFGHRYDLRDIEDTSDDQFTRGYDLRARSMFSAELPAQIQVKMRGDGEHAFSARDLYTMLDEGEKAGILPANLVLMIPTATVKRAEALSYKEEFRARGIKRMRIIVQEDMMQNIRELPPITGEDGNEEFLLQFRQAVFGG